MKKLFLSAIILLFMTIGELLASPAHGHYRWRNDDGTEANATWKANEDDSLVQSSESNIRLRMELYHFSGSAVSTVSYLYYASMKDTVWHQVSDNTSNAFVFYDSENLTNGNATVSNRLSKSDNGCVNAAGIIREMPGAFLVDLAVDQRKEYEFSIKPTSGIDFDQSFIFRVEDEDVSVADYFYSIDIGPRIHLSKPVLTVTAENASRLQGEENPVFTFSYSGFVDGDDESVLDQLPKVICSANASSAPGDYDIVPYDAADNKYKFNYVSGSLTVNQASGIDITSVDKLCLYPNPVQNHLYVSGITDEETIVRISDLSGRIVLEQRLINNMIDLQSLVKGIYIVKINDKAYKISKE